MKWSLIILLGLLMVTVATAQTICEDRLDNGSSCLMLSPTISCTTYDIIQSNTSSIVSGGNLTNLNGSIYYFNFTEGAGDYIIRLCDGSTREFRVTETFDTKFQAEEDARMSIATILGISFIAGFLLLLSFRLDPEHATLKNLFLLSSFSVVLLIPASLVGDATEVIFYKIVLWLFRVFWFYVFIYFAYWVFTRMNKAVVEGG